MARYAKIDVRIWGDRKFRALSVLPPCGQGLWLYLLTPRERLKIPGLIPCGERALSESLRWPVEAFRKAFGEVSLQGMAKACWDAPLVWVPNAIRYNEPESPNVVRSWRAEWDELAECPLKHEAWCALKAFLEGKGEGFGKAFREACPEPTPLGLVSPSPNQEQEQEQEQDQKPFLAPPARADAKGRPKAEKPSDPRRQPTIDLLARVYREVRGAPWNNFDGRDGKQVNALLGFDGCTDAEIERRFRLFLTLPKYPGGSRVAHFVERWDDLAKQPAQLTNGMAPVGQDWDAKF